MERKIGEIFEHEGEWYQCVRNINNVCNNCAFFNNTMKDNGKIVGAECNDVPVGSCGSYYRKDGTSICFKKLEKVGEPYISDGHLMQTLSGYKQPINIADYEGRECYFAGSYLRIEIKQNKEDMEEKKQKLDDLVGLYTSAKITYKEFDEKLKTLYADKEECKSSLKEFDLEAAKAGKPVCTRDGRKARIICFDGKGDQPIIALVEAKGNKDALIEKVERYFINGHSVFEVRETNNDLMMLPEKHEGWVNILRYSNDNYVDNIIYATEELAKKAATKKNGVKRIATVKIEWYE